MRFPRDTYGFPGGSKVPFVPRERVSDMMERCAAADRDREARGLQQRYLQHNAITNPVVQRELLLQQRNPFAPKLSSADVELAAKAAAWLQTTKEGQK